MITQNGIDAIRGIELSKRKHGRYEFLRLNILHIACKDNHVSSLTIDAVYELLQHPIVIVHHRTHVDIRELDNAVAIESSRQVFAGIFYVTHYQRAETCRHTVCYKGYDDSGKSHTHLTSITLRHQPTAKQIGNDWQQDESYDEEERYGETGNHFELRIENLQVGT